MRMAKEGWRSPPDHRTSDVLKPDGFAGGDHDLKVDLGLVGDHWCSAAKTRTAWVCTRNNMMGSVAVLLAALGAAPALVGRAWSWRAS